MRIYKKSDGARLNPIEAFGGVPGSWNHFDEPRQLIEAVVKARVYITEPGDYIVLDDSTKLPRLFAFKVESVPSHLKVV